MEEVLVEMANPSIIKSIKLVVFHGYKKVSGTVVGRFHLASSAFPDGDASI